MGAPRDIWNSYKALLKESYVSGTFDAWKNLWSKECKFVVQYGQETKIGFQPLIIRGKEQIVSFFSAASSKVAIDFIDYGPVFYGARNQEAFIVVSKFIATINISTYRYENDIICKVTLNDQEKIMEFDGIHGSSQAPGLPETIWRC